MPSPLGSFLLTLSSESQHSIDSGENLIPIFVSDNAKMMRRSSSAPHVSSNDIAPSVAAINVARNTAETKPTNWDRLCSPISERSSSVHKRTLSLPLRKLSNDNIASMARKQPARRSQSARLSNKSNDSFERLRGSGGRNASYNDVFAASLRKKPVSTKTVVAMSYRRKVSEDGMPGLRGKTYASAPTNNATFCLSQKGKTNPFISLFPTPSKEKDLNRPLECPQRKSSTGDNMFNMMKGSRTSLRTPSNQGNASFDTESLKRHGKKALRNPFKTEVLI